MFTGLVRGQGVVVARSKSRLEIKTPLGARLGDSIAVNGACLTVAKARNGRLSFDVSPETWRLTNLGSLVESDKVNLEPSLRAGDALGGHMVSGHVDATGRVLQRQERPYGFLRLRFSLPPRLQGLAARKGSIAVDGVSLTVTAVRRGWFEAELVPHTLKETTLGVRAPGDAVNLEADMIARYVRAALGKEQ